MLKTAVQKSSRKTCPKLAKYSSRQDAKEVRKVHLLQTSIVCSVNVCVSPCNKEITPVNYRQMIILMKLHRGMSQCDLDQHWAV